MNDADIRAPLRRRLLQVFAGDTGSLIVDELGVGQGERRADLAVVNGRLHGYEIKGPRDRLDRLGGQAEHYSRVFDRFTLIVHLRHAEHAAPLIPDWWGVMTVTDRQGGCDFACSRTSRDNPGIDPVEFARLLWRDEALAVLARYGLDRGVRSKPKRTLHRRLGEHLPFDTLRHEVLAALRGRRSWRADALRT